MVKDIHPGTGSRPGSFAEFNNNLYFSATDETNGNELWVYDGINPPTIVEDINKIPGAGSDPIYMTVFNNKLYFGANDGINGDGLSGYMMETIAPPWLQTLK